MSGVSNKLNQKGVTLIEVIVALALLSLITAAVFGMYHIVNKSYQETLAYRDVSFEADMMVSAFEKDLRSAVAPNTGTEFPVYAITSTAADADRPSVTYLTGQRIDIYTIIRVNEKDPDDGTISTTGNRYKRIRYAVEADGSLRRGWVRQTTAPTGAQPRIGNISNWQTVAPGITNSTSTAVPSGIFVDATSPATKKQRLITLTLWLRDTGRTPPRIEPVAVRTQINSGY